MAKTPERDAANRSADSSPKPYIPRVFVSATTCDLGSYRKLVCDELWKGECFPVVQEYFRSDPRPLLEFLEDSIRRCDMVICLLGTRFGEAPDAAGGTPRSYTQLEYDMARQLNKDIHVFMAAPSCPLDEDVPETEDRRRLQQQHVESVQRRDEAICMNFAGPEELRAHIIRLLPDLTKAKLPKYWVQSPAPYPYFAGRETELRQLTEAVTGKGPCVVVVLGVAGQGKTTLTWEWFHNHGPDVFAGMFWCPAEDTEYTFDVFLDLALAYLRHGKYDKRSFPNIQSRIRLLVQHLCDRPCLLVVDGVEKWLKAWRGRSERPTADVDADGRSGGQEGLDSFLGQLYAINDRSHVVLTSRVLPAALDSAPHAVIPVADEVTQARLQGLDELAATGLLRNLGVKADEREISAVAHDLEYHPLSLTIVGKLATRKYSGRLDWFRDVPQLVTEDKKLRVLLQEIEGALPAKQDSAHLLDILAHFRETPSYEQFSGFLRGLLIRPDLIALVTRPVLHLDDGALREALAVLDDWSLATWDRCGNSLHLHPLLREHFRRVSERSDALNGALARWYLSRPIPPDAHQLQDVRSRVLAIEHGLLAGDRDVCDAAVLSPVAQCSSLPQWLALWGHQSAGVELLGRVSLLSCGLNRQKHLISRGALAQDLDKLTSAHDELTQAISWLASNPVRRIAYRETLGGAYMNRGSVVAESGRPAAAIPDFDAALNIVTWPFGIGRPRGVIRGDILTNRGSANRDLGHLSVAITDATDALDTYRQCLQRGSFPQPLLHRRIATVLMNRGNAMANARQYDSAASDYSAALAEISQVSGEEGGRVGALRALIRVAEGQRFQDIAEWQKSTIEYTVAVDTLSELVRQGSEDIRTTLALALANRAVSYIALDELQAASDDIDAAQRIYDRASWESSSRLAVWVAANQTALAGLGSLLRKEIAIGDKRADVFQSWKVLSSRQGNYVLAPFVRATTGIARLAFPRAPRFSADAVVECVAMIEEGTGEGYWSEWLVAEVKDLHAFVQAQAAQMTSFGVSVDQIARVTKNLEDRAKQGRGGSHVLN